MADLWADVYWRGADGLTLHARDYAAASGDAHLPVICLHGLTRNARDFEDFAPRIAAQGRRVLAIDVRGRGLSDRDPEADYRFPTYVADVVAMAAALGIGRTIFVGTSMGGLITMELATQAPTLIAAAVINDVGPELNLSGLGRIAGHVGKVPAFTSWNEAAEHQRAINGHALPHYQPSDWLAMARRLYRQDGHHVVADYDPAIADRFADEPLQIDPWERWQTLVATRPVLVLRGTLSDLLDAAVAERMVADSPNTRLQMIEGVGHAPMLDEPEAVAAVDAFLADLP